MLTNEYLHEIPFWQLEKEIKIHEDELKRLKNEANRRASLVEG